MPDRTPVRFPDDMLDDQIRAIGKFPDLAKTAVNASGESQPEQSSPLDLSKLSNAELLALRQIAMEGAKARVADEVVAEFMVPAHSLFAPDNGKLDLKQIGCSDRTPKTPKENRNAMRAKAADARTCVDASSDYVFC